MAERVVVPSLTSRAGLAAELFVVAVGVVVFTVIWVAGPWLWWLAAPALAVLAYVTVVVLTQRTWLDPDTRTLTRRSWALRPVTMSVAGAIGTLVARGGGGGAALRLVGTDTMTVPVASISLFANRTLPSEVLRALAGMLDGPVAAVLRAQADHVDSGGPVETSPVIAQVSGR